MRSDDILCANRQNTSSELAGPSHYRNTRSEPVRRQRAGETRSGRPAAFVAGRH
jgi:hypothetical protein